MSDSEANRVNIFNHAENVRMFDNYQEKRLPVTIVTGFLGAGKTTLLNHILTNKSNLRIAAAINDFAELNIDENLVRSKNTSSKLVELSNGCVCCHLLDNLQDAIFKMLESGSDVDTDKINYLVVETSGVSDPLQIIRKLDQTFGKCYRARLDSVVTVIDSDRFLHEDKPSDAAVAQLECADVVIMNKMDLLDDETACLHVEKRIRAYNEDAVLHRATQCNVPLSAILDVQIPDSTSGGPKPITHESVHVPVYVSATGGALRRPPSLNHATALRKQKSDTNHLERNRFVSVSATVSSEPLSLSSLQIFLCSPLVLKLARIKGVLWIAGLERYRCVVHLSGRGRLGFELDGMWSGPPRSEMAFIGTEEQLVDQNKIELEFAVCGISHVSRINYSGLPQNAGFDMLCKRPEFCVPVDQPLVAQHGIVLFYLTGSKVYGYSEKEIETELRIDTDAMNMDLADAVNASVDNIPKAFLAYTRVFCKGRERTVLCYPSSNNTSPANNENVLLREVSNVLSSHFRNVQVCKCGA